MASHRIGFLISHKENIKNLNTCKHHIHCLYILENFRFFLKNRKLIKEYQQSVRFGREHLVKKLRQKGYKVNNSMGNSIFLNLIEKKYE